MSCLERSDQHSLAARLANFNQYQANLPQLINKNKNRRKILNQFKLTKANQAKPKVGRRE
jgi:hypothetical protein